MEWHTFSLRSYLSGSSIGKSTVEKGVQLPNANFAQTRPTQAHALCRSWPMCLHGNIGGDSVEWVEIGRIRSDRDALPLQLLLRCRAIGYTMAL